MRGLSAKVALSLFFYESTVSVWQQIIQPFPLPSMSQPDRGKTSSLHWISSHSEGTMQRGSQATWTLMTRRPITVQEDRVSGTIDQGEGTLLNANDYLSWPSAMKKRRSQQRKEMFPKQLNTSVCLTLFFFPLQPPSPLPCFILSLSPAASPYPLPTIVFKACPRE